MSGDSSPVVGFDEELEPVIHPEAPTPVHKMTHTQAHRLPTLDTNPEVSRPAHIVPPVPVTPTNTSAPKPTLPSTAPPPLPQPQPTGGNDVVIKIGHVRFLVDHALLTRHKDSNLYKMLDGAWEQARDEIDGSFTIMRSPFLFPLVLQLLHGVYDLPLDDIKLRKALVEEIDFYGLTELQQELQQHCPLLGFLIHTDGLYFSIDADLLSASTLEKGDKALNLFNHVSPNNVLWAFKFDTDLSVQMYKRKEGGALSWTNANTVFLGLHGTGTYEVLADNMFRVQLETGKREKEKEKATFSVDSRGTMLLDYRGTMTKVIYQPLDSEMVSWLRFPTE